MKKLIGFILITMFAVQLHAATEGDKPQSTKWYDSAKKTASDVLEKTAEGTKKVLKGTEKAAHKGIKQTTKIINKSTEATKEGLKAFKRSFNKDNSDSQEKPPMVKEENN